MLTEDGFDKDAWASTLRTVLGYESQPWHGLKALLEFENFTNIGNDLYNSTQNGETDRPIEADPDGTSVHQVYGSCVGLEELDIRAGRQEITLDNRRFIGNRPWRQKHQAFDAVSGSARIDNFHLYYAYAGRINTVFRRRVDANAHLLNLAYVFKDVFLQIGFSIGEKAKITGIFHDFRTDWGGRRYGREFDLLATYDFNDHSKVAFKLATYWSDKDFVATDITTRDVVKAWLWFRYRF